MASVRIHGTLHYSSPKRLKEAMEAYDKSHWVEFVPTSVWTMDRSSATIDCDTEAPADAIDHFSEPFYIMSKTAKSGHITLDWCPQQAASEDTPASTPSTSHQARPPAYERYALSEKIYYKGRVLVVSRGPDAPVTPKTFDPRRVFCAYMRPGFEEHFIHGAAKIGGFLHSPDNKLLISLSGNGNRMYQFDKVDSMFGLVVFEASTGKELDRLFPGPMFVGHTDYHKPVPKRPEATAPAWSPDGQRLALWFHAGLKPLAKKASRRARRLYKKSTVIVWDVYQGTFKKYKVAKPDREVVDLTWSEDSKTLNAGKQGSWEM